LHKKLYEKELEVKMSKQTAVQWLYDELSHCLHREEVCDLVYKLEQKALEMEREQRIDFAKKCLDKSLDLDIRTVHSKVEEYYNKTYGGQDESNH
jgi:hypothetical protein